MIRRHRAELAMFAGAYVLYNAGRWVTAGEIGPATCNAHWIWHAEQALGVAIEHSVQSGLQGTVSMWLLSHIYLAAQLVVLPGALLYLYRRAPEIYAACAAPCSRPGCSRSPSTRRSPSHRRGSPASASPTA